MPAREWEKEIHARLLEGDPTAPAELAEEWFELLITKLSNRCSHTCGRGLISQAVEDALIDYLKNPSQFDGEKLSLFGFLRMVADRDIRNELAKLRRRSKRERPIEDVEHLVWDGNRGTEERLTQGIRARRIAEEVAQVLDEKELEVFELMVAGERRTSEFAEMLGLSKLPSPEQRREVKRWKDRIKKRLQRHGVGLKA
ncbi:MAG: RNA polymerase sigma factor [Acidobacteriota bacterium]